jgi:hypothetical protein
MHNVVLKFLSQLLFVHTLLACDSITKIKLTFLFRLLCLLARRSLLLYDHIKRLLMQHSHIVQDPVFLAFVGNLSLLVASSLILQFFYQLQKVARRFVFLNKLVDLLFQSLCLLRRMNFAKHILAQHFVNLVARFSTWTCRLFLMLLIFCFSRCLDFAGNPLLNYLSFNVNQIVLEQGKIEDALFTCFE